MPLRACGIAAALLWVPALAVDAQTLRGTVRDARGVPVANASVSLTCGTSPSASSHAATAADGTYRFAKLLPCTYSVAVQQGAVSTSITVEVDASQTEQTRDITLGANNGAPRPKFEASGIRGLIDPGGYSAPANAAAASSLLSGLAEANRNKAGCAPTRSLAELEAAHRNRASDVLAALDYADALLAQQQFAAAHDVVSGIPESSGGVRLLRLQARANEGLGQFQTAADAYARAYALHPSPEDLFAEGYEQILSGKPAIAATLYRDGLQNFNRATALLIGLGTTEFLAGQASEATRTFLTAAEADPADPRPYPFLAAVPNSSDAEKDRVSAAFERHLSLAPRDASAHLALATVLLRRAGDPQATTRAEAELRTALGLDASLVEAHYQLGSLMARRSTDDEAVRELQLAVRLAPDRREAHYRLAQELRKTGQTEAAAEEMQRFQQARTEDDAQGSDVRRYLSVMSQSAACHPAQ